MPRALLRLEKRRHRSTRRTPDRNITLSARRGELNKRIKATEVQQQIREVRFNNNNNNNNNSATVRCTLLIIHSESVNFSRSFLVGVLLLDSKTPLYIKQQGVALTGRNTTGPPRAAHW